jgi:hypothetical protein
MHKITVLGFHVDNRGGELRFPCIRDCESCKGQRHEVSDIEMQEDKRSKLPR